MSNSEEEACKRSALVPFLLQDAVAAVRWTPRQSHERPPALQQHGACRLLTHERAHHTDTDMNVCAVARREAQSMCAAWPTSHPLRWARGRS
jgi:hypothetical protein